MNRTAVAFGLCAIIVTTGLGCDDGAQGDEAVLGNTTAELSCTSITNGAPWWNQGFTQQTGRFHIEFSATPSAENLDTVIGLSNGPATKWTSLAAIVRFNPDGFIDVRSGDEYRSDGSWPYTPGTTYQFRLDVDMSMHQYAVWIRTGGDSSPWNVLVRLANFRTEQLGVAKLTNVASFTNPDTSGQGGIQLCGFTVVTDTAPTSDCTTSTAGGGFVNKSLTRSENVLIVSFRARALQANMDGVVGVSSGAVDSYEDFAASIRFYTNGRIEVRDGDAYRADQAVSYLANQEFDVRMFIDLPSHTYSVYVNAPGLTPNNDGHLRIASGYKFRPSQMTAWQLDNLATVVASPGGSVDVCGIAGGPHPTVQSLRDGNWDVEGLANGSTLISKVDRTMVLASNNVPMGPSLPFGGVATGDSNGNYYVVKNDTSTGNVVAQVTSYEPDMTTRRWGYNISGSATDIAVTPAGEIVLSFWNSRWLARLTSDGRFIAWDPLPDDTYNVALGRDRYAVARSNDMFEVYAYGDPTHPLQARQMPALAVFEQMSIAPDGSLIAGGQMYGTVNFGDGDLTPVVDQETHTYLEAFAVALGPDLTTRFSRRLTYKVRGVSAMSFTTGRRFAVSMETAHNASYVDYVIYDGGGNVLKSSHGDAFVGTYGIPGPITMTPTGMVYLNENASLVDSYETYYPFLVAISPW